MPENDPNLIPLPSIGESKVAPSPQAKVASPKSSKLWIVVLTCIVAGIGLGVVVYQQSITPAPVVSPKPKPTTTPAASPKVPNISAISPQSNTITFPKAGEVRVYFGGYGTNPAVANQLIRLTTNNGQADLTLPGTAPAGDKMVTEDSQLFVQAGQTVTIKSYDRGNVGRPSYGWILPDTANKCGVGEKADAAAMISWATQRAMGEPLVSIQCWADWSDVNDTSQNDFNDFLIILSYKPAGQQVSPIPSAVASPNPSRSPSVVASKSPSPSPVASPSKSPVASPSRSPSPSPVASTVSSPSPIASVSPSPVLYASVTPTPSPRVTMPEASTLPDAGIFEVTVSTIGIGLVFILVGLLGLLLI